MRCSCGRRCALSNRWSWVVILVEVASSHELPVSQLPIIADIGRLARMLLSHVQNGRASGEGRANNRRVDIVIKQP